MTEKDCATDGDTESQGRGVWEGPGSGCQGEGGGAQVRRGGWKGGQPHYCGDPSHPRWPWLPQGDGEKSLVLRESGRPLGHGGTHPPG